MRSTKPSSTSNCCRHWKPASAHQAEKLTPNFNSSRAIGIERSGGWPLVNAVDAYRFSSDPYYLNAARLMIERFLERQYPATGV